MSRIPSIYIYIYINPLTYRITYSYFLLQNLVEKTNATDASGNIVYGDIGVHIQQEVSFFRKDKRNVCKSILIFY